MKKGIIIFLIFVSHINFAQNIFPNNGNVGIGTLNPTQALDVNGNGIFKGGILSDISGTIGGYVGISNSSKISDGLAQRWVIYNMSGGYGNSLQFWAYDNLGCVAGGLCTNRFTIMDNGNVGIGTSNPNSKLEVIGDDPNVLEVAGFYNARVYGNANDKSEARINIGKQEGGTSKQPMGAIGAFPLNNTDSSNGILAFYTRESQSVIERIRINSNGNVGIGTSTPVSKLSIAGSLTLNGGLTNSVQRPSVSAGTLLNGEIRGISNTGNGADDGFLRLSSGGGTNWNTKSFIDLSGYSTIPEMNRNIVFGTTGSERMRIDLNGNIGIGTTNPDSKLAVNGTVHSKEVKVDMNGWSDYVFKKEYNLPTLEEVEKHITEKGHLENIPSEQEVLKNGINLGEMNAKLLQKIEEMTLYMIEQNKSIEKLKEEIKNIKSKM